MQIETLSFLWSYPQNAEQGLESWNDWMNESIKKCVSNVYYAF